MLGGVIERIKTSSDPLSTIKKIKESGINFQELNAATETGAVLCKIVRSSFGLGLKILIDCGLDLSLKDINTGDTPLLLTSSEGLCGAVRLLIDHLPWDKLLVSDNSGSTPLKHLLTRGHGSCGCIEKLLARLPTLKVLLPAEFYSTLHFGIPDVPYCVNNSEIHVKYPNLNALNNELNLNGIMSTDLCSPNENHVLLLSLRKLLERIQTEDCKRIISVIHLWIKANLLLLQAHDPEEDEINLQTFATKLFVPIISKISKANCSVNNNNIADASRVFIRLIILKQFNPIEVWHRLRNKVIQVIGDNHLTELLDFRCVALAMKAPLDLRALTVLAIRRQLQTRFAQACCLHSPEAHLTALAFIRWIDQLALPKSVKKLILLDSTHLDSLI